MFVKGGPNSRNRSTTAQWIKSSVLTHLVCLVQTRGYKYKLLFLNYTCTTEIQWKCSDMRFVVTPCVMKSVGSENNRWLTTQRFDHYALIVFRRMIRRRLEHNKYTGRKVELSTTGSFQNQHKPQTSPNFTPKAKFQILLILKRL